MTKFEVQYEFLDKQFMHSPLGAAEGPREDVEQEQPYYDDAISQYTSVMSFAPYPSTDEATASLNSSPRPSSPTSSIASSKRLVYQEDLVEPKRKKQMTNSEENSVPRAPTKPVMDSVQPCNATLGEPNEYSSSNMKVNEDLDTSKNLVAAEADAKVLDQNEKKNDDKIESNGKYYYGFETDGTVDKSYYMDQLENLNGESFFPDIYIGSPLTGTLMVSDTHRNNQQFNDQLPYWSGEMDPIDDIQFD
ncbi:hypothetical protein K7X08_028786 [Anisodus acutangulus]|uniref:Uncharacterized protein n=1 Tax=Anisodus acutangulus TaxID=402998 RepID=A0A9Q1QTI5_9SOLA|nr:hypothetical protein K7X08_028786 [Anisodus acutangulus]